MRPNREPDYMISVFYFYIEEMVQYNALNGQTYLISEGNGRLMWAHCHEPNNWRFYQQKDKEVYETYCNFIAERELL